MSILGFPFDPGAWLGALLSGLGNVIMQAADWLWNEAVALINWLLSLLPALPIWPGPSVGTSIGVVLGDLTYQLNTWNYYICINLMIVLWMTSITAEALGAIFRGLRWAFSHIPWVGGD